MDIKPVSSATDLRQLVQPAVNNQQVRSVMNELGLKSGDQFVGLVEQVNRPTTQERAQLLQIIQTAMAQLNKNSAAPSTQFSLALLQAQETIVQSPALRLITLLARNPLLPAQNIEPLRLLTYATETLNRGQQVLLQINANQRVQILQTLSKQQLELIDKINIAQTPAPNANSSATAAPTNAAATASLSTLLQGSDQQATNTKAINQQIIRDSLLQLLPAKDSGNDLLASLPKVLQFIQQIQPGARADWFAPELQTALKQLANHIRSQDLLTNPKMLAASIANNGQHFEHKLAKMFIASPQLTNTFHTTTNTSVNLGGADASAGVDKLVTQDLKGMLLRTLHLLGQETGRATPLSSATTTEAAKALVAGTLAPNITPTLVNALPSLLNVVLQKNSTELNDKQLRTQLIMLLHQYTLGSLAKIQLRQAQSLSHQLSQLEQPQPSQSWQVEIPLRYGQDIHPLQIQLEQKWIEEGDSQEPTKTERQRQWSVTMNFDLPEIGKLYAQLQLVGERLNLTFWAEQQETLQQAQQRLAGFKQQLEKEGLMVAQLQCLAGAPPSTKMTLGYALVDVKT